MMHGADISCSQRNDEEEHRSLPIIVQKPVLLATTMVKRLEYLSLQHSRRQSCVVEEVSLAHAERRKNNGECTVAAGMQSAWWSIS
jgi:hypothetical protein